MSPRIRALSSSVTQKTLLALSGFGWFVFVASHLYSNIQLFFGREAFNTYYEGLKAAPGQLWTIRAILIAGFVVHIGTAWVVSRRSIRARSGRYHRKQDEATTYAGRTMRWTGPFVGLYIVLHILHLTMGSIMPPGVTFDPHDDYANVVQSFRVWWVALFYALANGALALHLAHGVSSVFQTLGLTDPLIDPWRARIANTFGILVAVGFLTIPVAVWIGAIG